MDDYTCSVVIEAVCHTSWQDSVVLAGCGGAMGGEVYMIVLYGLDFLCNDWQGRKRYKLSCLLANIIYRILLKYGKSSVRFSF